MLDSNFDIEGETYMKSLRKLYYRIWYRVMRGLFSVVVYLRKPVVISGSENIKTLTEIHKDKGVVVMSNHRSHLDVFLLSLACKQHPTPLRFFASHDLINQELKQQQYEKLLPFTSRKMKKFVSFFLAWFTAWFVTSARSILVDRDNDKAKMNRLAIVESRQILDNGGVLGVFPQGGINRPEAHGSGIYLAERTNSIVLPIHIKRKPKPWNKANPWRITIGVPLEVCTVKALAQTGQTPAQALMTYIYAL